MPSMIRAFVITVALVACKSDPAPTAPMVPTTASSPSTAPASECADGPADGTPTLVRAGELGELAKQEADLKLLPKGSADWTSKVADLHNRYARLRVKATIDLVALDQGQLDPALGTAHSRCQIVSVQQRAQAGEDRMAGLTAL